MHLANYLGMMHRAEFDLANGFRVVAEERAKSRMSSTPARR